MVTFGHCVVQEAPQSVLKALRDFDGKRER